MGMVALLAILAALDPIIGNLPGPSATGNARLGSSAGAYFGAIEIGPASFGLRSARKRERAADRGAFRARLLGLRCAPPWG